MQAKGAAAARTDEHDPNDVKSPHHITVVAEREVNDTSYSGRGLRRSHGSILTNSAEGPRQLRAHRAHTVY
jgi:hypothetical protein